jgi:hypothetical protein
VTGIAGTLSTAAQNTITSVGTLTSLAVTGNITGGNVLGGANVNATTHTGTTVSVTGNITGGNLSVTGIAGTLSTASQTAITGVGTLTVGTWNATSISTTYTDAKVTSVATRTGAVTLAQADISGLTTGSSPTFTGLTVATGNITAGNIVNGGTTGTGNIGSATTTFNTVFAKATTAQYADLAEMYTSDAEYEPGTVMDFGGDHEVTVSTTANSNKIAGVVSTNPAHLMNSTQSGEHVVAVALTGRVPTRVTGTIWKGAMMVSAGNGQATASATPAIGTVLGKSLEDFQGESGVIQVVVGRL